MNRIAIVEDDASERTHLSSLVTKSLDQTPEITEFTSAEQFLFEEDGGSTYDLIFLDVELGGMSGLELARRIRARDRRVQIIFVTSHAEFIGEGYEVDALHYIVKPAKADKVSALIAKADERLSEQPRAILIENQGELLRIGEDEIVCIESLSHYLVITTDRGEIRIKESLSAFEKKLSSRFFRLHRSYIASLTRIVRISRSEVELENGTKLPLSRGLYDKLNRAFIEYN